MSEPASEAIDAKTEMQRTIVFMLIQGFFLAVSPFTGGFHFKVWSMLDSALLVQSIGITGLVFVLESRKAKRLAFTAGITLYIAAIIDMSVNILLSGIWGFQNV